MKIAIYQINPDRDENNVAFLNYENLERFQGSAALRSEIYDKVFEGEVECGTLEEVYQMFNLDHPDGYRGRSLSVSDVVEVVGEEKSTFHFCDSIGFREVDFDPDMTEPLKEKKIKVVLCEPGKVARVAEIGTELSDLQRAVGGLIEPYYPFEEQVCIVCNDEGKYNGMRPCRAIYGEDRGDDGHYLRSLFHLRLQHAVLRLPQQGTAGTVQEAVSESGALLSCRRGDQGRSL